MERLLSGLRVVELAHRPAGWYAGSMFALLGAQVTAFRERATSVPARYRHLDRGKRVRAIDWADERGAEAVRSAAFAADVLLTALPTQELEARGLAHLASASETLVHVALTPFGLDGPYRDYRADELILQALMGLMDITGDPDRPPLKLGGEVVEQMAGLTAFVAAETALLQRGAQGRGQLVDVSMLEAAVSMMEHSPAIWTHRGVVRKRSGNWGSLAGWGLYPARDGFAGVISGLGETYQRFRRHIGGVLLEPRFEDIGARAALASEMNAAIIAHTSERSKREVFEEGQRASLPFGYVCTVPELLDSPQLAARSFFEESEVDGGRYVLVPGLPFSVRLATAPKDREDARAGAAARSSRPLGGIRVLDLGVVWAGPHCTRLLADMGAEVIKVEGPDALDPIRGPHVPSSSMAGVYPDGDPGASPQNRHGYFNERNRNKLGVVVDLKRAQGRDLLLKLVAASDVLVENFSAGTMERLGLGYVTLAAANPALVYLSMPAFGNDGPEAHYRAYGVTSDQLSALVSITGYGPGEPSNSGINVSDPVAGTHGAAAVLAALIARTRIRRGCFIDLSHREATVRLLAPELVDYQLTGTSPTPRGNRHVGRAPHGCYRCRGEDRWIAISASSDEEWLAIRGVLEIVDTTFSTRDRRLDGAERLDALMNEKTAHWDAEELMSRLQQAGVMAADVRSADRLFADPQLRSRRFFRLVEHPEAGAHELLGLAWKVPGSDAWEMSPAPCAGQHNRQVLRDVLGYPDAEIDALERAGIIGKPQ